MTHRHAHCPECGVSAGLVCRDLDDTPAVETCPGRPLLPLHDSVERTKVHLAPVVAKEAKSARQRQRHAHGAQLPRYSPCTYCGVRCKLLGGAVTVGHTICGGDVCRRMHEAAKRRSKRAAKRDGRQPVTTTCPVCDAVVTSTTRMQTYCTTTCRETAKSRRQRYARNTVTTLTT
jgi:hypothetical protein